MTHSTTGHRTRSYDGMLEMRTKMGATIETFWRMTFDLASQRFWRLRYQGGILHWDTSLDGTNFVTHARRPFVLDAVVRLSFGAGAASPIYNGGRFTVERVTFTAP